MLYDTHCHLTHHNDDQIIDIIDRAKNVDIRYIMSVGTDLKDIDKEILICKKYSDDKLSIHCSVALHPENLKDNEIPSVAMLTELANKSLKIKAIGETGLDTHLPENLDFFDKQIKSFENHIETAINLNLPLIIHSRESVAVNKCLEILKYYQQQNKYKIKAVLHSFTGTKKEASDGLDIGCYVSFSGIATFKNADNVREVIKYTPFDKMLIETDAPYLAPVPVRGRPNETSYVAHTAHFISNFLNISYEDFCNQTTKNGRIFFDV